LKLVKSAVALAIFSALAPIAARAADVTLYSERDYRGDKKPLDGDWKGGGKWGDKTHSIRVPDGYRVTIYRDEDFKGESKVLKDNWNPSSKDIWSGRVRSVRVQRLGGGGESGGSGGGSVSRGTPAVYTGNKWNGKSLQISGDWRGDSDWDGSPYAVQSVRVPSGWTVTVYSGDNFSGKSMLLTKDFSNLSMNEWKGPIKSAKAKRTDGGSWNDSNDSDHYRPTTKPGNPDPGYSKPTTKPAKPVKPVKPKTKDAVPVEPVPEPR
jgi:hypothetical protein